MNKNKKNHTMVQLNKNINLYKERAWRVITYNAHLSENGSTGLYTLSTGSDQRYLTFATLLSSDEFVNMAIPYNEFRIHKAVFTSLSPQRSDRIPYLYVNVEPSNTAANPNNVRVCAADTSRIMSPRSLLPEAVEYDLRGVGTTTNIWIDTGSTNIPGQFNIGNYINGTLPSSINWEVKFQLIVEFTNPK